MGRAGGLFVSTLAVGPRRASAGNVLPVEQSVRLELNPADTLYQGAVTLELDVEQPLSDFRIHARELRDLRMKMSGPGGEFTPRWEEGEDGVVTVHAPRTLAPGRYRLEASFTNDYDPHAKSLYRVVVDGEGYLYTQFQVRRARRVPVFDEPSFKIPWSVELTVPASVVAISNGRAVSEEKRGASKRVVFERTPPLSTTLGAFAVGRFDLVDSAGDRGSRSRMYRRGHGHLRPPRRHVRSLD